MKVTVTIPDEVFRAGERFAKRRRIPRSRLYTTAVSAYVKTPSGAEITRRLNQVYAKESSQLDADLEAATGEVNRRERWD